MPEELPQQKRVRLMRLKAVDYFQPAWRPMMRNVGWLFIVVILVMVGCFLAGVAISQA